MAGRFVTRVWQALAEYSGPTSEWLVGEPFFDPPSCLVEAIRVAAERPHFAYSPPAGLAELRAAVAEVHQKQAQDLRTANVTVTQGAKSGLLAVLAAVCEPGDEVLHPVPCYPAYSTLCKALGVTPVPVDLGNADFRWNLEDLAARVSTRTRAVLLSSPSNPSGAALGEEQGRELVLFCRGHGLRLITDEAYEAYRFVGTETSTPAFFDFGLETVIQVRSFSKTYAVCGWRIGYVLADCETSRRIAECQGALLNPPNTLAQMALTAISEVPEAYAHDVRNQVAARLRLVRSALAQGGLKASLPDGGFYLWLDVRDLLAVGPQSSADQWCASLAERHGVGFWPGEDFAAPGWVRVSAVAYRGNEPEAACDELAERLRAFMGR